MVAPALHGAWITAAGKRASSGTQRRTYVPSGSNFSPYSTGLKMRKYGASTAPEPATHCQLGIVGKIGVDEGVPEPRLTELPRNEIVPQFEI